MELSAQLARYENLRSETGANIAASATYHAVGSAFDNPVRILKILNLTDALLVISYNGVDDKDVIAPNSYCLLDYSSDKSNQAGVLEQPAHDRCYVRYEGAVPTTGSVYVTVIYASTK